MSFFAAEKLQLNAIAKLSTDYLRPRSFTEAMVPISLKPCSPHLTASAVHMGGFQELHPYIVV